MKTLTILFATFVFSALGTVVGEYQGYDRQIFVDYMGKKDGTWASSWQQMVRGEISKRMLLCVLTTYNEEK